MLSQYTLADVLEATSAIDWSDQSSCSYIEDIEALKIDQSSELYIGQGSFAEIGSDGGITHVVSEGFSKCTALILRSTVTEGFLFAHLQPFDDLYYDLEPVVDAYDQGFLAYGTHSVWQRDVELLLAGNGVSLRYAQTQTDRGHFGVSFDMSNRQVSVVRKMPDHTIVNYHPFTTQ